MFEKMPAAEAVENKEQELPCSRLKPVPENFKTTLRVSVQFLVVLVLVFAICF